MNVSCYSYSYSGYCGVSSFPTYSTCDYGTAYIPPVFPSKFNPSSTKGRRYDHRALQGVSKRGRAQARATHATRLGVKKKTKNHYRSALAAARDKKKETKTRCKKRKARSHKAGTATRTAGIL